MSFKKIKQLSLTIYYQNKVKTSTISKNDNSVKTYQMKHTIRNETKFYIVKKKSCATIQYSILILSLYKMKKHKKKQIQVRFA